MFEHLLHVKLLNNQHSKQLSVVIKWKNIRLIGHVEGAEDDAIAGCIYYFDIKCCDELILAGNLLGV